MGRLAVEGMLRTRIQMDWTTNVAGHTIRGTDYFDDDEEGVCEACHTGFYKPSTSACYWTDEDAGEWEMVQAASVKRHPQQYELSISGDSSFTSGGDNVVHAEMSCAECHGGDTGDIHTLPGLAYEWSEHGDVQCTECHDGSHDDALVALHMDGSGQDVACIGCHTFGMARDFELETEGSSEAHDVFIDPETGEVRPVVYKNGHAIAWYSHNWQTFDGGEGVGDTASDCAQRCHYDGNLVDATAW